MKSFKKFTNARIKMSDEQRVALNEKVKKLRNHERNLWARSGYDPHWFDEFVTVPGFPYLVHKTQDVMS